MPDSPVGTVPDSSELNKIPIEKLVREPGPGIAIVKNWVAETVGRVRISLAFRNSGNARLPPNLRAGGHDPAYTRVRPCEESLLELRPFPSTAP